MFFKFTTVGNGSGQQQKILTIVQVKQLPEGSFFVREVLGLSMTGESGGSGYLMFVPKRCGNKASNMWLHKEYFIKHIREQDRINAHLPGGGVIIITYYNNNYKYKYYNR